jgi:hypothetical protein
LNWAISTFTRLPDLNFKDSFILDLSESIAKSIEERLKPENLPDSELKELPIEFLKGLMKQYAQYKSEI